MFYATTDDGRRICLEKDGTWSTIEPMAESSPESFDFRRVNWGCSIERVLASEHEAPIQQSDTLLVFAGSVAGLSVHVAYIFVVGRLTRAKYISVQEHSNSNDQLIDLRTLKQLLTTKYGDPAEDNTFWSRDLFKDDPSSWGLAVSRGDMKKFTTWQTPGSTIILYLTGENFDINLGVEYMSEELANLEEHTREREYLDDL